MHYIITSCACCTVHCPTVNFVPTVAVTNNMILINFAIGALSFLKLCVCGKLCYWELLQEDGSAGFLPCWELQVLVRLGQFAGTGLTATRALTCRVGAEAFRPLRAGPAAASMRGTPSPCAPELRVGAFCHLFASFSPISFTSRRVTLR